MNYESGFCFGNGIVGHDDAFLVEAGFDAGTDFTFNPPVLADRADNSDLEADGVFVEGDNAHDIRHSIDAIHLFGGGFHFLFDHGHEAFLIFLIGAGDIDDGPFEAPGHIGDGTDIAVGNTVNISVVITDGGGADGNSLHGTIQSVNADQVAHGDLLLTNEKIVPHRSASLRFTQKLMLMPSKSVSP